MSNKSIPNLIIDKFGLNTYKKSLKFLSNKINIFYLKNNPIKIRSIILDNEREYHLIIDERKNEIFHDCPIFLIHSEREKKVCVHLIKLLLILKQTISQKIIENLKSYNLTSEDYGSKKKSKNFLLLADKNFEINNYIEVLSYLHKAIINQYDSEPIIEKYLNTAIKYKLFLEFFEFLQYGYENEYLESFVKHNKLIEKGFIKFLNVIPEYSFFNLLRIIESLDKILEFKDISFLETLLDKIKELIDSSNFKNRYFSIYLIRKNFEKLIKLNPIFKNLISDNQLKLMKKELLDHFFSEIDNFCIIDKLKLLKNQFSVFSIPKERFYFDYKKYKNELKALERKVYLKKFAFLKLLIEKHKLKQTNGEFRKKRNAYIVRHDEENLKNPVYTYIISRIGFYGLNEQTIKSSEIGINIFIMNELFLDDLSTFQDVDYYKKQFWGENEYSIKAIDGFSLLSKNIEYRYESDQEYKNDLMIIEWDLANKPIQGSIVSAYGSQIIVPDQNNPLFHDLKPFDLCYCKKTPVKIESNIIKTVNIITKCSFKDAIKSVSKGITFIEGYYPLSLVEAVIKKEINPFQAIEIVENNPNKSFVLNYNYFVKAFKKFLVEYIFKEKDYIYEELKSDLAINSRRILTLLDLHAELSGLNIPFTEILLEIITPNINLNEFKNLFLNKIHNFIINVLYKRELGSTIIFDLKRMRNTQFTKYSSEILNIRKKEFESAKIIKQLVQGRIQYDISEICQTFYGKKLLEILHINCKIPLKPDKFKKFQENCLKVNLKLNIVNSGN